MDADGWLHTGDIGIVDGDGYLSIVDRLKELIKVKGFQVAPAELEALLLKHPRIADVAVIPVPDDERGRSAEGVRRRARRDHGGRGDRVRARARCRTTSGFATSSSSTRSRNPPSGKILRRVLVERERAARA